LAKKLSHYTNNRFSMSAHYRCSSWPGRARTGCSAIQATIIVSYRADSLSEAGEKLDDVLLRARERGDIETESIEVHTPVRAGAVSLPHVERALQPQVEPQATGEGDSLSAN
jgi:hypothetical protein